MRWYLGILGFAIFGAGSLMSWGHTATFFADNGFGTGRDPYYGVVVVESLFLMGAGAEIYMRKTGQRSTGSIKLALAVGAATVFWANFRYGLSYGWEGMAAGTIIIVAIVIAENVLADIVLAIQKERAASEQENVQTVGDDVQTNGQTVQSDVGTVQKPDAVVTESTEDRLEIDGNVQESEQTVYETADAPAVSEQENVQTDGDDVQTVQKPDAVVTESTEDRLEIDGNVQESEQTVYETADAPAVSEQENVQTDGDDVQTVQKPDAVVTESTEDRLEIDGNVRESEQTVYEMPDTPAARLYMYHREKGKLPGRVRLARMCGMEVKDARRVLDRMNRGEVEGLKEADAV